MKKFSYCVLLVSLSIVLALPAVGQTTITASDVGTFLTPGGTTSSKVDTGTHTANIGTLGSNAWDFSGLGTNYTVVTVYVRPDTTAFFSYFPTATHALKAGTGYVYFNLATDLQILGFAQPPPTEVRSKNIPAEVIEKLPMTAGTTWTATYAESSYVTISGTTFTSVTNHVIDYTVDAFGSLTLPGGGVHQALRLKSDRHTTSGGFTYRSISYQFLAKDGATVSVVPSDTNQPQTGTISVSSISWSAPGGTTAVEEIPDVGVPARFALEQNYPNPFNPSTTIEFSVAENAFVSLKVYNLVGQELSTLVSQQFAPGTYSARWDALAYPSGVYLYRLQTGAFTETRRLVLLR
jgi:hypothetical protein